MKYLIKIKSKTKNPNAGNTCYRIAGPIGPVELTISPGYKIPEFEKYWRTHCDKYTGYSIPLDNKEVIDILKKYSEELKDYVVDWEQRQEYSTVYSLYPEPQYHYEYEDTEVECEECHKRFCHKQLLLGDDLEDWRTCPYCASDNCCDIEYERDILK